MVQILHVQLGVLHVKSLIYTSIHLRRVHILLTAAAGTLLTPIHHIKLYSHLHNISSQPCVNPSRVQVYIIIRDYVNKIYMNSEIMSE